MPKIKFGPVFIDGEASKIYRASFDGRFLRIGPVPAKGWDPDETPSEFLCTMKPAPQPDLDECVALLKTKFAGLTDKGGEYKTAHCWRVLTQALRLGVKDWRAALLHDIIEDTATPPSELRRLGYSAATIKRVELLTNDGSDYWKYIKRVCASGDREAILIKIADNIDNTDERRLSVLPEAMAGRLRVKYHGVGAYLREKLSDLNP